MREELTVQRAALAAKELALGDLRGQLLSFEGRYIRQVAILYKQLDEWEKKITELHASHRAVESFEEAEPDEEFADEIFEPREVPEALDLKALFRELAKRIHPDFATDDLDAQHRTRLMAQANDAYNREDATALQRMLNGFDPSTVDTSPQAVEAEIARTRHLIERVQQDIAGIEKELETLAQSELAKLQERTIQAALEGRDLLAEMAARVKGRIGLAMRQYELDLDRIKRPPRGALMESLLSAATPTTRRFVNNRRT